MIRLVTVALLALALGFGLREALPRWATAPVAARTVVESSEAQITLGAPGLL